MNGLASDWTKMIGAIQRSNNMVGEVAVALADASEGDEGRKVCSICRD